VRVAFLDGAGDTLAIADAGTVGTGRQVVAWHGEDWESPPAEAWEERAEQVVVEARPTYSSRRRFARVRVFPMVWDGP